MLDLGHLTIERVAVFHIPEEGPDRAPGVPTGGDGVVNLTLAAKAMLTKRLAKSLGKNTNGIQVTITETGVDHFFQQAAKCMGSEEQEFLSTSGNLAVSLAKSQVTKSLPASKLMVIEGAVTAGQLPYMAFIKAELQDALAETSAQGNAHTLNHLTDIFLTESQRLFKIGFIQRKVAYPTIENDLHESGEYSVHLFDHLMTALETKNAAHYFYNGFLGCSTSKSARAQTREFYDNTLEFIKASGLPTEDKLDLTEALRAELRSNNAALSVAGFSDANMSNQVARAYRKYMFEEKNFPGHAIEKDAEYVKSRLKRKRKIKFTTGIELVSPPELMNNIQVTENEDGSSLIHLPGSIEKRE